MRICFAVAVAAVLTACQASEETVAGFQPPAAPEPFYPALFATEGGESWFSPAPDGRWALIDLHDEDWEDHRLFIVRREGEGWAEPVEARFDGEIWGAPLRGARFSPDGRRIVFSARGRQAGEREDYDLYLAEVDGYGFTNAQRLPEPVNSEASEYHASFTASGALYFSSPREGGEGRSDIYRAEPGADGAWTVVRNAELSTELSEADSFIDPLERFIIFARTNAPDGLGGDDLYIARREGEGWSAPEHLGPQINDEGYDYGPHLSPDGRTLFFTTFRGGDYDIWHAPAPQ